MSINNYYEFNNKIRDLDVSFETMVAQMPVLMNFIARGADAESSKIEWLDDVLTPFSTAIGSFDTDGDGTGVNVTSTTGILAGDILSFESSTGDSRNELVRVASVDSATELTVVRQHGSSPAETLVVGDVVKRVARPKTENYTISASDGHQPTAAYNYTQIFEHTAQLSRTALQSRTYGNSNTMEYQIAQGMKKILWDIERSMIWGYKVAHASGVAGMMGGLNQFLTGGNVDSTGGAISKTIINNVFESIFEDGGMGTNYALLCAQNQARKISAFNTSGTNPVSFIAQGSEVTGNRVSEFIGDIPVVGGLSSAKIIVSPHCPTDRIYVVDLDKLNIRYLQPMATFEVAKTTDGIAEQLVSELSIEIKNGTTAHGMATGLTA